MGRSHKSDAWHLVSKTGYRDIEAFLRAREKFCVGACSKFITGNANIWTLNLNDEISGFLLHSRRSLYPIFCGNREIPLPKFLNRFLRKVPVHSVQGLGCDTSVLESGMEERGYRFTDRIDYDLMTLDSEPLPGGFRGGPPGLTFRIPADSDFDELFELQSAYEKEEVVPAGGYFSPDNCRKILKRILCSERIMIACLGNIIAGKINTNAESFSRYQIGGVYVRPEFRGAGIATRMSAEFMGRLISEGRGISLYVKKRNAAAGNVYRRLGFLVSGDYKISYY